MRLNFRLGGKAILRQLRTVGKKGGQVVTDVARQFPEEKSQMRIGVKGILFDRLNDAEDNSAAYGSCRGCGKQKILAINDKGLNGARSALL